MKIAIIGSRTFKDYELLKEKLLPYKNNITLIISGGAKGADSLAELYATEQKIETKIIKPDWEKFGRRAGFIRNTTILENSDFVIAFWDRKSKGTLDSIKKCELLGIEIRIQMF